jgi:hypothetical protein
MVIFVRVKHSSLSQLSISYIAKKLITLDTGDDSKQGQGEKESAASGRGIRILKLVNNQDDMFFLFFYLFIYVLLFIYLFILFYLFYFSY